MNNKPFEIKPASTRWAPGKDQMKAFNEEYEKLLPPLLHKVRKAVEDWREDNYAGASHTTISLLNYWFNEKHVTAKGTEFQFFFGQREAIESIIYLFEIAQARDKYEMMKFDSSERISTGMFDEEWARYVVKMATGTGKTKVLGLAIVWSYFNSLYEENEDLSRNFLVIAPNIIVLNRIIKDFEGFRMFFDQPFLPENGYDDKNWQNDFQLTLHIQDELKPISPHGNVFLTNIHRVFMPENRPNTVAEDFLGYKPKSNADTARQMDLGKILRSDQIKDLAVLNDEAHHIHDPNMAWFQAIQDINNKLKLKNGKSISFQADFTATPKHNNGAIFVQTIADYPLVEAIRDNVIKSPVLPDDASRNKIEEKDSNEFLERYEEFIRLGVIEWQKQYAELKQERTPILFIMTNDTKEANQAAEFLEREYPEFQDAVLTIHTKKSGELKEDVKSDRAQKELEELRKAADSIDSPHSNYKAVCSVLMLREGWDVTNVSTIVGLRPFSAESKILPEQAIGRGLRKMFNLNINEKLTVLGTQAFIDFVEGLKTEGVEFQYSPMGEGSKRKNPIIVEVDKENEDKDKDKLDIPLPQLSPRIYREYKNIEDLDIQALEFEPVPLKTFGDEELKEIVFTDIDGKVSHTTVFKNNVPDYRHVLGFFTQSIMKEARLVSGFNILYPKVEAFIKYQLFGQEVTLSDLQVLRNLSEAHAKKVLFDTFRKAINDLTVTDKGDAEIKTMISLKSVKPKVVDNQKYLIPNKSLFNKVIGDNEFELAFAAFLENNCKDVIAYAKNTTGEGGVNFKMEYQSDDGNIRDYFPDFFVKTEDTHTYIVETKGREEVNDLNKIRRLVNWCEDVNRAQDEREFHPVYIKQEEWEKHKEKVKRFSDVIELFKAS